MKNASFSYWCNLAASEIRYRPDRDMVYRELEQHMYDRYDSYIAQGYDHEQATQLTLDAMGNATKVAAQMGDVHRPFWGNLFRACCVLSCILLLLCILTGWDYLRRVDLALTTHNKFDTYSADAYGGDTGRTLRHLSRPMDTFSTDGSTFRLIDAALYSETDEFTGKEMTRLYVRIRHSSLLPWQEHRYGQYSLPISAYFVIKDDSGKEYPIFQNGGWATGRVQTGIFSCVYECWVRDFDADSQWVAICYLRDGRQYTLRIDLSGGDGK